MTLESLLACPHCHGELTHKGTKLFCPACSLRFPRLKHGYNFHSPEVIPQVVSKEHVSNGLSEELRQAILSADGAVLNLGAGATQERFPNCFEFEYKLFKHTDVIGDAHKFPFKSNSFSLVLGMNVFEHLANPFVVAEEIRRILKPGGRCFIHTAFLQPLHEAPHHYYNATEYGVRNWFNQFDIEYCRPSWNFSPVFTLSFLLSTLLSTVEEGLGPASASAIGNTTLKSWSDYWRRAAPPPPSHDLLNQLSSELQARVSAGFELSAVKIN